jgi:hypothetical protein
LDLAQLTARFEGVRLATVADNRSILDFFNQKSMETESLSLRYERDPDFFAFLRMQSPRQLVFMGEGAHIPATGASGGNAGTWAIATMTLRQGYIAGQATTVGYLGDLRVGFDRRLLLQWRKVYGELLKHSGELEETGHCRHFITAVIDGNSQAIQALVNRPKSPYLYRKLAPYRMVNLLGRLPSVRRAPYPAGVTLRSARPEDLPALRRFLDDLNRGRAFGFRFGDGSQGEWDELNWRLENWKGLELPHFQLALGSDGRVIACFAPWTPSPTKKIVVDRMPFSMRALTWSQRLATGDGPREGSELKMKYLTALEVSRELDERDRLSVFRALLDHTYSSGCFRGAHLVAFTDFPQQSWLGALGGYLKQTTPMTLYQVLHREYENDPAILRIGELPPGFEMALV